MFSVPSNPRPGGTSPFQRPIARQPSWRQCSVKSSASIRALKPSTWLWTTSNIHCRKTLTDYFGEDHGGYLWNRLTVHYTPRHGSWLNQAEIEISLFARQCLGKRRIPSLILLRSETRAWNRTVNRNKVIIDWRFTRLKARQKFNYDTNSFMRS
jgi:hypothetical protein